MAYLFEDGKMIGHISLTRFTEIGKIRRVCPTCEHRRTMLCRFQEWYGWYVVCLGCGERWQDGERLPRPFKPRWRQESIESARQAWKQHKEQAHA